MLTENPESNDPSKFVAMVTMAAKRAVESLVDHSERMDMDLNPNVVGSEMEPIDEESFWDTIDGYFSEDGWSVQEVGDLANKTAADGDGDGTDGGGGDNANGALPTGVHIAALKAGLEEARVALDVKVINLTPPCIFP